MNNKLELLANYFELMGAKFKKKMHEIDMPFDCNMKECHILSQLYSPKMMSELASSMDLTPGTMTVQIDSLINRKLVRRVQDNEDRRKIYIYLTKKGEKITNQMREKHLEISKEILEKLSKIEQDQFIFLLKKITTE